MLRNKSNLFLIFIFILALFLRFYRLSDLSIINYDEARNLIAERKIIVDRDIILLGPDDHVGKSVIYFGPIHYYLMLPGIVFGSINPPGTYIWTAFLGSLSVFIIYLTNKKLISAAAFAVFPWAVYYSRSDWLPNDILVLAPLFFLALFKKHFFWAGLFMSLAIQAHTTAAGLIIFFLIFGLKSKRSVLFFTSGITFGLLPVIAFDLTHGFRYLLGFIALLAGGSDKGFQQVHYYLWLVPPICLGVAKLPKKFRALIVSLMFSITLYHLASLPTEVVLNSKVISQISKIIAIDSKKSGKSFNVATFTDPNTRGMSYRYYLSLFGVSPKSVEQYNSSDLLYVITFEKPKRILETNVYEITSFAPKRVTKSWKIETSNIYRLEKK